MVESLALKNNILQDIHISDWSQIKNFQEILETKILPSYLVKCRWFRSKTKAINTIKTQIYPTLPYHESSDIVAHLLCLQVEYMDASKESYFLPITLLKGTQSIVNFAQLYPKAILCKVSLDGVEAAMIDAIYEEQFRKSLFEAVRNSTSVSNEQGTIRCETGSVLKEDKVANENIRSKVLNAEQSNTSIIYNDQYFLKIYRKLEFGLNPDLEVVRFLSERTNFSNAPKYGGSLLFLSENKRPIILGLIQNKIVNKGDAWETVLEDLSQYYNSVPNFSTDPLPSLVNKNRMYLMDVPQPIRDLIGRNVYQRVTLLGKRTAQMHIALASNLEEESFSPTPFAQEDRNAVYTAQKQLVEDQLNALQRQMNTFSKDTAQEAQSVIAYKDKILSILEQLILQDIDATQTRVHGDYHLGQVLDDGEDFHIIDFEGEPMRTIEERRQKTSPFKDVAGMLRSFHYAAYGELYLNHERYANADQQKLEEFAAQWFHYISHFYLTAYFDQTEGQSFIPKDQSQLKLLLRTFVLEKAIYELGYEMNSRPDWLKIPLRGVLYELE